ncbi:MAG: transcription antitermination factor NusB [Paracoccus sp. (in: a-proteobacteria)]|uniref:RsmB/NOP family class I SAM-dependent RNA methyltransferase n=1 Tax=Paracoccus sp. TaxID=267 RepID=UPI0026E0D8E9|nr:transcription antitermination factor NusB [Paracoccus sp. (in: a-proteobacteria)]MDO5612647.1 transcription antitermination factor NusB [Paracoccus sp. (in: a-proteobacteria)]
MAKVHDPVRHAALSLLRGVREGVSLSDQTGRLAGLAPADRARAGRLAAETLRHAGRADAVLAALMDRRPRPEVGEILRMAVVEMLQLDQAPHGVVNAAVALVRGLGPRGRAAAGMANAVLRKAAATTGWDTLPPQRMPGWLRDPVVTAWGEDTARAIETAHQAGAPLDLTPRNAEAPGEPLPTGSLRLPAGAQVSALPGYDAGNWWVQDAAAALAVRALEPQPGEHILDLCAAPGGKTLQLAAAGAEVTALDISAPRMARVQENLNRCGLTARLITADALSFRPDSPPDAILLDAPCSATGTIRRHPDLPFLRDGSGIAALTDLQAHMIDHALTLLPPGGRLVYAVCSLLPAEGEDQIAAALARHPDVIADTPTPPGIDPAWLGPHGLRLRPDYWPDQGGMDGFFIARLRKPGQAH